MNRIAKTSQHAAILLGAVSLLIDRRLLHKELCALANHSNCAKDKRT